MKNYLLINKEIIPSNDPSTIATMISSPDRIIKQESLMVKESGGKVIREIKISTVFLVIDHNYSDSGKPILFETMTFGGTEHDQSIQLRCSTYNEALKQHENVKDYLEGKISIEELYAR